MMVAQSLLCTQEKGTSSTSCLILWSKGQLVVWTEVPLSAESIIVCHIVENIVVTSDPLSESPC